ncbi:MAG: hypothetical protein COV46_01495 [Deltaproteobacteria bacterium CG11_big_fil_rev_8_21_14_0_20_49_13]|nr:MAG: hypothetical protein COV46_01495 [Deltaproteobacteria bacterium CG11_big_fil_rev_8_21_14_0_20_49_13]
MNISSEARVGIFALVALFLIGFITVKVGSRSFIFSSGYEIKLTIDSAIGIRPKTPVEIAGIKIGKVKDIELVDSRMAMLTLKIDGDVSLPPDSKAMVRAKGFLGDVVVEIIPGYSPLVPLKNGSDIEYAGQSGDVNILLTQFNSIAGDVKAVSSSLKEMIAGDQTSPMWHIVKNLEAFTKTLADNQGNFNKVSDNLAALTESLSGTIVQSRENVEESIQRISSITKKIDEGKGTVGKLINDDTTVVKLNEAVDNLNGVLGGLKSMQTEIGFHTEYLANSEQFRNDVNLTLRPKPDKAFILDFITQQNPDPSFSTQTTNVTVNGTTTQYTTNTQSVNHDAFKISAQIAKSFYDFTVRGGIVESSGGVGLDYNKGPVGASFTAYNFQTDFDQKPHLRLGTQLNLTKNIYVLGGADNMIAPQNRPDWFFGAGIRLPDEDIKSLFGVAGSSVIKR